MFITMLGDMTAFVSIIFGYFFYWTSSDNFPPEPNPGPGIFWPALGTVLVLVSWILTIVARRANKANRAAAFYLLLGLAAALGLAGGAALLAGPYYSQLDPTANVYPATVWLIMIWAALHVAAGILMQLYCVARRAAGRMSAEHDIDITNVTLYWHFMAITVVISAGVVAGFPLVD